MNEELTKKINDACLGQRYPISNMMKLGFEQDNSESDGFETIFRKENIKVVFEHDPMKHPFQKVTIEE